MEEKAIKPQFEFEVSAEFQQFIPYDSEADKDQVLRGWTKEEREKLLAVEEGLSPLAE